MYQHQIGHDITSTRARMIARRSRENGWPTWEIHLLLERFDRARHREISTPLVDCHRSCSSVICSTEICRHSCRTKVSCTSSRNKATISNVLIVDLLSDKRLSISCTPTEEDPTFVRLHPTADCGDDRRYREDNECHPVRNEDSLLAEVWRAKG